MENDQVARLAALVEPRRRAQIEAEIEEEVAAAFASPRQARFPTPQSCTPTFSRRPNMPTNGRGLLRPNEAHSPAA